MNLKEGTFVTSTIEEIPVRESNRESSGEETVRLIGGLKAKEKRIYTYGSFYSSCLLLTCVSNYLRMSMSIVRILLRNFLRLFVEAVV